MTPSTEQDRAEFERLILETDGMKDTGIGWADRNPDGTYKQKQIQKHFLTWQAARRAQVVPQGWRLVPVEPTPEMVDVLISATHATDDPIQGLRDAIAAAPQSTGDNRLLCDLCKDDGGYFYGRTGHEPCCVDAAPQPPEAKPVQMPEPVGVAFRFETEEGGPIETSFYPSDRIGMGWTALYTEHQVRQLLAAHGIK